jgi:hypothetical protein
MVWSSALVAVIIAGGLESPPPFGAWASSWGKASGSLRASVVIVALLFFRAAARQLLRPLFSGESDAMIRLLPLERPQRYRLDWISVAAFLAVPLLALSLLALLGDVQIQHDLVRPLASFVVVAVAAITVATNALQLRSLALELASTIAGCLTAAAATTHSLLLIGIGAIGCVLLLGAGFSFGAIHDAPRSSMIERHSARTPRQLPMLWRGVVDELRWIARSAPSPVSSFALAVIALLAAPLAAHNNSVSSLLPLTRIWTLCAAVATGLLAYPLLRTRTTTLRYRALEELLPLSGRQRLAENLLPAAVFVSPLALLAFTIAPMTVALIVTLEILLLICTMRFIGEIAARTASSRDSMLALTIVATAMAMGLHPLLGFTLLVALTFFAAAAADRSLQNDFPRFAPEELE